MLLPIDLGLFLALTAGMGCTLILGVWFWYDRREALLNDPRRIRSAFVCTRCGQTYLRPRLREEAPCPGCGWNNVRLKF
jgi:hypothetical protein